MSKGCWKVNENDEAIYIDLEDDSDDDDTKEYSQWSELPDLLLEQIFSQLTIKQKYYASLVCRSWYRAFNLSGAWASFTLEDNTLVRGKYNFYSGWQYVLDHLKASQCLVKIGKFIRELTFEPMLNFHNLYDFMNMLSWYSEQSIISNVDEFKGIGQRIKALKFTFPCNMASRDETERMRLFGTGGRLLEGLKRLIGNITNLQTLELIDLLLDKKEAKHLLDEVCVAVCTRLQVLVMINTTRLACPLLHVGVFLNLQTLVISPQSLDDDVIDLLGYTKLMNLHIIQNRYTPSDFTIGPVSPAAWKRCRKNNKRLSVHLEVEATREKELLWQEGAPVKSILYQSPHIRLQTHSLITAVQLYKGTLKIYGHLSIPRFHQTKSFHERIDSLLLLLCRQAPYITTLIIRERISTSTILLLAFTARNLRNFYVRRNAVILKSDWPMSPDWSSEFYYWIKSNSRSYDLVETEVSQILGYRWTMLTDKEFKKIPISVHATGY